MMNTYGTSLLRLGYLILKNETLAEDALQDAFVKAYEKMNDFKGESNEKTWLTRILVNTCKDYLKSSWFRKSRSSLSLEKVKDEGAWESFFDDTVTKAIQNLSIKYRLPILLHYYENHSIKEISTLLKIPEGTVKSRLNRGREELKVTLKGWYDEE